MISLETARKLKEAGLVWVPAVHDFFAIPDRNLDEHKFVISNMLVTIEALGGLQIVSFQGASEWALDYLVVADAVWLPREDQLRSALEALLLEDGRPELQLICGVDGCRCSFIYQGFPVLIRAERASEAYARALQYVLRAKTTGSPPEN